MFGSRDVVYKYTEFGDILCTHKAKVCYVLDIGYIHYLYIFSHKSGNGQNNKKKLALWKFKEGGGRKGDCKKLQKKVDLSHYTWN